MSKGNRETKENRLFELLEEKAISINVFIKRCLGCYNDELMRTQLTHRDLVKIFPYLKRTSYDVIMDDPACLYTGDVVAVVDSTATIILYQNTQKAFLDSEEFTQIMDNDTWSDNSLEWSSDKETHAQSYDLKTMSTYELSSLMKLYTKTGQWHDYEVVRRELISRDDCARANKKSKRKALVRSLKFIKDDEY